MNDKKLLSFIILILFRDWGIFGIANICTIIGFLITPFSNSMWNISTIIIFISIIIVLFIAKIIRQFYIIFNLQIKKLKIISIVKGEGTYTGHRIIKLEKADYIQKDTLLTLFSTSTGVMQPICILHVVANSDNSNLLAVQLIPSEEVLDISRYFEEEVRLKSLYVSTLIDIEIINKLGGF